MSKNKKKKKNKKPLLSPLYKICLIVLMLPVTIAIYIGVYFAWEEFKGLPFIREFVEPSEIAKIQANFDLEIPVEYIPIYMEAGEKYNIPWTLLAAHHRIETRFSTMQTLISPVGAEGHLQFMPCTWVGWQHNTCSGLGEGEITDEEKLDPQTIALYGGYGVDADGDGIADPFHIEDAIYSAANFLAIAGAANGELEKAIFQYNHSEEYVEDILYYYNLYNTYKERLETEVITVNS
ncbi:lytic transglycosylase domain-containing protein [Lysinibacillus sp. KU-BSD001]|uniref:lytic transglycosylase domain-containing protein n=1 Tax=Lysinibacillus sp. KU-BSD001 TaxID=3141328 RepID=UPI0036E4EBDD